MDESIYALIHESGLPRIAGELQRLLRPSIRLSTQAAQEDDTTIGASKIGGAPDLPAGAVWPEWKDTPMSFLAQIRLRDIAPLDTQKLLPPDGVLSFFCDAENAVTGLDVSEGKSWRVIFSQDDSLKRVPFPERLSEYARYKACAASFAAEWTLPGFESPAIERLGLSWETKFGPGATVTSKEECELYFALTTQLDETYGRKSDVNRILGYPDPIQNDVQSECQYATHGLYNRSSTGWPTEEARALRQGALEWELLLQLDSLDEAGMMWGDVGRLYFMIPRRMLAERNFDATWLIMQCS